MAVYQNLPDEGILIENLNFTITLYIPQAHDRDVYKS